MVGGLYTEPKVHYVAVLHHVVLALQAELARFPCLCFAFASNEIKVGDSFDSKATSPSPELLGGML